MRVCCCTVSIPSWSKQSVPVSLQLEPEEEDSEETERGASARAGTTEVELFSGVSIKVCCDRDGTHIHVIICVDLATGSAR